MNDDLALETIAALDDTSCTGATAMWARALARDALGLPPIQPGDEPADNGAVV